MDTLRRPAVWFLVALELSALGVVFWVHRNKAQHEQRLELERQLRAIPLFVEAPDITLFDRSETPTKLSSYRGRVVFVNFWATWCGPCVAEMASMVELHADLDPADIAFVSISEDDTWPPVDAYLKRTPLPFDLYRDRPPRVELEFKTGSYPTSFLIDRDGTALYRFGGARDWNTEAVRELLALEGVGTR